MNNTQEHVAGSSPATCWADLMCGDCLGVMRRMPDKSVDAIITDPPYGLNIPYASYTDTQDALARIAPTFVSEARRIARRVILFPGVQNITLYPPADWVACWFYGTTGSWGKLGYNSWQPLLFYGKNNRRYGMDTIKWSKIVKKTPGHPCPKPEGLMEEVVKRFSDEGETVMDPFMGIGTTGVACKRLSRRFIGIDIDPGYCDIAVKRIDAAQPFPPNSTVMPRDAAPTVLGGGGAT
jgi:site-specific DNA-methyltransferase (adenine-specific)